MQNVAMKIAAVQMVSTPDVARNLAAAGQLQQDTTQNVADSNRNEFLRLQGLGEASGTGMLGGFSPVTTTTSQSSK